MNIYFEAFGIFFKIGAFTIGGGYAMVPLIENEIVTKRKWITQDDFINLLAISQSAPGILAVNISIFIGYKLKGIPGSIITALGTILPSFIIILAIALFFHNFQDNVIVERIFKGIRPAVVAPVSYTHLDVYKRQLQDGKEEAGSLLNLNWLYLDTDGTLWEIGKKRCV